MMSVLARASASDLQMRLNALANRPAFTQVRRPEVGLVMIRGRIAGSGAPFNVGEATVTRSCVQIASGEIGVSYILGRDVAKANDAALVDALWQCADWRDRVEDVVVRPLAEELAQRDAHAAAATAQTRVDFFTLVRGED